MENFTNIPMRTFNWLGVNSTSIDIKAEEQIVDVPNGESQHITELNLGSTEKAKKLLIKVGKGAKADVTCIDLASADSFIELIIDLEGDDSQAIINSAYFGSGNRKVDLNYVIRQHGRRTKAVMDVKGALSGSCDKIFRGTLDFLKGAKGSEGREREEVIVLSDSVRNKSVPLMLSHEDDVDGHHAVTVGRIDEEKLYYLMSRGLDRIEAEKLIVEAMFNPLLEQLDEEMKSQVYDAIQRRLSDA